jgi:hypothetical protein
VLVAETPNDAEARARQGLSPEAYRRRRVRIWITVAVLVVTALTFYAGFVISAMSRAAA